MMRKKEILEKFEEIKGTMETLIEEITYLKTELENLLQNSAEGEEEIPTKIKLLKRIYDKEGIISKKELYQIWEDLGRDTRGLGGFFRGRNSVIAEGPDDKVFLTRYGKEALEDYFELT
ncbi:MAG: hypothetical protein GWP10_20200 [Nitrospiraceae bacterium]|nr:hypothetical protein [Nitrospiraceae bacterium]